MTSRRCGLIRRLLFIIIGILFIIAGVLLYINWIDIFTRMRGKEMALSPTSPAYPNWKVSPLPLYLDVYLFNWTNPEDFYVGSKRKPKVEQIGPYRFREKPDKVDIEWHTSNVSISFRKKSLFYFDANSSRGSLEDKITSVNTVAHTAALRAKNENIFQKLLLKKGLQLFKQGVSITKTAEEWMFKGFIHPLVNMGKIASQFSDDFKVPYDRIGYFYTRNDSAYYDGHFNMFTGADDVHKMGQIHTWNHMTHNGVFPDQCGEVKGSMGEFFPPNLTTNDTIYIYLPDLCRAIPLDYTETVKIHGVTAYKFSGGRRSIDNGTLYPETKCFCVNGKCEAYGVINIGPCKYNSSSYTSYPHFYQADPSFLEAIDGLKPDKEKHEFFMTLEPNGGLVMDVGGGFQGNYLLEPIAGIPPFNNIERTFMPLMWAEERVRVSAEIAKDIALVPFIVLLGQILTGMLFAGGIILICWYPTKCITHLCHDPKKKSSLLNPLSCNRTVTLMTQQSKSNGTSVPLLDYKNGKFIQPNGIVKDSLLNNTLSVQNDVIIR
ncbi:protein peste [Teleopsis dalmanni]|uniref:protein peste n=1 Tax=Teleopsis dalmanni TaxID=139649 RepID=UPI0018CCBFB9|nr:protein peste [Teleopsis dalmanni]XP_037960823.1 protein peste [Teleopsis dalmanni]